MESEIQFLIDNFMTCLTKHVKEAIGPQVLVTVEIKLSGPQSVKDSLIALIQEVQEALDRHKQGMN